MTFPVLQKYKKYFLITLVVLIIITVTKPYTYGANDNSRLATIESLVNRQTFVIDESPYDSIDKIFYNNHFYSSKPPILSVAGAIIFLILKKIFALSLAGPNIPNIAQYLITLIIIGGSFSALLITFFKSLQWFKIDENTKYVLTFLLGFGTYIFSYLGTFNNHIPAATAAFISFYYLLKIKFSGKQIKNNLFYCGMFLGLAGVIDIASTALGWIIFYFIYFLKTTNINKKYLIYLIVGFAVPILIHLIFNLQITGDLLPAYLHKSWYYYPGSHWNNYIAEPPKLQYIFNLIFGNHGIFLYSPILLISFGQLIKIIKNKTHNFYNEALLASFIIIFSIILITFFTSNYGGSAYGMRWFIAFIPMLFFFNIFYIIKNKKFSNLFIILAAYSIIVALLGVVNPWSGEVNTFINNQMRSINFPILFNLLTLIL